MKLVSFQSKYFDNNKKKLLLLGKIFGGGAKGPPAPPHATALKWLLFGTCHPPSEEDQYYCNNLDKTLDTCCQSDKIFFSGDFNSQISEVCLDSFQYDLKNLMKKKTFQKCV